MEVKVHVLPKYACPKCRDGVASPPVPPKPIPGGIAGAGLVAFVVVSKFADHLPLYRLEDILTRHGVFLARSTLCDWVRNAAILLEPLAELQKTRVLQSPIIWTDDTPVTVLGGEQPGSSTGRFWVYIGDVEHPYSVYDFSTSRSRDGPAAFLKDYGGFLQADAYGGYDGIFLDSKGTIVEVACWAHCASEVLRGAVERAARGQRDPGVDPATLRYRGPCCANFTPEQRQALRQQESVPILDRIEKKLDDLGDRLLPKSAMGKAVTYARNQWAALRRYVTRRSVDDRQQRLGADVATPGHRPEELVVPGECRSGTAGGGVVHDPGGSQASSPGAVGLSSGRGAAAVRGRDGPGIVAPGPLGREPPGACAATPSRRVAA